MSGSLTEAEINVLGQDIDRGDRAGFYLDYYNDTGSAEALVQAQISSFSGFIGLAAKYANDIDSALLGSAYPGVIKLSLNIATSTYNLILDDFNNGGSGVLSDLTILNNAENQWAISGIESYFPGNALVVEALFTGNISYAYANRDQILTTGFMVGSITTAELTTTPIGVFVTSLRGIFDRSAASLGSVDKPENRRFPRRGGV